MQPEDCAYNLVTDHLMYTLFIGLNKKKADKNL